jgi:PAS domain S-box-containing protein
MELLECVLIGLENRMRTRGSYKTLALLALLLAVLLLGTFVSYRATSRIAASQHMVTHTYQVMEAVDLLSLTLQRSQTAANDYVSTGKDEYLAAYRTSSVRIAPYFETLRKLTADNPEQQSTLAETEPRALEFKSALDRLVEERQRGAVSPITADQQHAIVHDLRSLRTRESILLEQRTEETERSLTTTRLGLLVGAGLNCVLLLLGMVVMARDQEQRSQIRQSKLRLAAIVDSSDDAIIGKTLDGTITSWNRGAERLYGYRSAEMIGKSMFEIVPPERTEELRSILERLSRGGKTEHLETVRLRRDGAPVEVEITVSPVADEEGRVMGASAIGRDITERKRMERSLHQFSIRILRAQDEERRRIAREIHDTTVQKLALLSMNLAQLKGGTNAAKVPAIVESSQQLTVECVQELRTLSYLLHPPMLDELGLASALKIYVEGIAQRSGIAISTEIEPGLPRLDTDAEMALFRVAQESLSNVLRHSGSKTARIRLANHNGIEMKGLEINGLEMKIIDEGHGIAAKSAEPERQSGMGVGILGMNERINQLGGTLMIDSGPGGTTVTARVPLRKAIHA